jgi:hypothetical protein
MRRFLDAGGQPPRGPACKSDLPLLGNRRAVTVTAMAQGRAGAPSAQAAHATLCQATDAWPRRIRRTRREIRWRWMLKVL